MEMLPHARQGGAVPRSLPAGSLRSPLPLRAGFLLLGAGAIADLAYHAFHGWASAPHTSAEATAIHLLVLAGMTSTLAGLFLAAIRSIRRTHPAGRRTP